MISNSRNILNIALWFILIILAATLFIKLLPLILLIGVGIWGVRSFRKWRANKNNKDEYVDNSSFNYGESYSEETNGQVIDVDYTEVK